MGLDIFRHTVIEDEQVSERITGSFVTLLDSERFAFPFPNNQSSSANFGFVVDNLKTEMAT